MDDDHTDDVIFPVFRVPVEGECKVEDRPVAVGSRTCLRLVGLDHEAPLQLSRNCVLTILDPEGVVAVIGIECEVDLARIL
eukprot:98837-Prymnesium_polylepis.2